MNTPAASHFSPGSPLSRADLLTLLNTALAVKELRYARRLAVSWLAYYPGDLGVSLLYAKALSSEADLSLHKQAIRLLEDLLAVDPEYVEANRLYARLTQAGRLPVADVARKCLYALNGAPRRSIDKEAVLGWPGQLREARQHLARFTRGDDLSLSKAEAHVHQALVENPATPLPAVVHLSVLRSQDALPALSIQDVAYIYHERWPKCLQFTLVLAHAMMDSGLSEQAVSLLHQAAASDIAGQVPARLWGIHHPYRGMWPEDLSVAPNGSTCPQAIPVPARVSAALGWNQLPAPASYVAAAPDWESIPTPDTSPAAAPAPAPAPTELAAAQAEVNLTDDGQPAEDVLQSTQSELERIAHHLKHPHILQQDGRFPIYIILSTRHGLETQYGAQTFPAIHDELKALVKAMQGCRIGHENWGASLFLADDLSSTDPYHLKPARHNDPWSIKLALTDLDKSLNKRGERIGAVLIVGGPEVVPFHHLPNPVDDVDKDVPSDNPYSTRDENYFIMEWPVGRIATGKDGDHLPLVAILRDMTKRYTALNKKHPWVESWLKKLLALFKRGKKHPQGSFGYSAAVWRRASLSVFRTIGDPRTLLVSPPVQACDVNGNPLPTEYSPDLVPEGMACFTFPKSRLGYFNLHGVPDATEWYGQRDPTEPGNGPDFPIAIRPQDIANGNKPPQFVFSEACYGAHIYGKSLSEAIVLKFLASGCQAVVGSTCISYGSIATPLIAADLLGRIYWNLLEEGYPAGEALRRAKLALAREMNRRQGYLDGEDQKTIISFVLYGDPLAQPAQLKHSVKTIIRTTKPMQSVKTVCDRNPDGPTLAPIPNEVILNVKGIVAQYLPGMSDAQIKLSQEHSAEAKECHSCQIVRSCPTAQMGAKTRPEQSPARQVVTLSKSIEQARTVHKQFARLTLDPQGKLVKLVVSR